MASHNHTLKQLREKKDDSTVFALEFRGLSHPVKVPRFKSKGQITNSKDQSTKSTDQTAKIKDKRSLTLVAGGVQERAQLIALHRLRDVAQVDATCDR